MGSQDFTMKQSLESISQNITRVIKQLKETLKIVKH